MFDCRRPKRVVSGAVDRPQKLGISRVLTARSSRVELGRVNSAIGNLEANSKMCSFSRVEKVPESVIFKFVSARRPHIMSV